MGETGEERERGELERELVKLINPIINLLFTYSCASFSSNSFCSAFLGFVKQVVHSLSSI